MTNSPKLKEYFQPVEVSAADARRRLSEVRTRLRRRKVARVGGLAVGAVVTGVTVAALFWGGAQMPSREGMTFNTTASNVRIEMREGTQARAGAAVRAHRHRRARRRGGAAARGW